MCAQSAGAVEYTNCRGAKSPPTSPAYDTKQSDCKAPVMLKLLAMMSSSSLTLLSGSLKPKGVAPDRIQSIGQMTLLSGNLI